MFTITLTDRDADDYIFIRNRVSSIAEYATRVASHVRKQEKALEQLAQPDNTNSTEKGV